jgi:hypothetical protein
MPLTPVRRLVPAGAHALEFGYRHIETGQARERTWW